MVYIGEDIVFHHGLATAFEEDEDVRNNMPLSTQGII